MEAAGNLRAVHTLEHISSGKVREIYSVADDRLVIVATDRISAFDVILDEPIPDKGRVLTGLSLHWLGLLDTPNHLLSAGIGDIPGLTPRERAHLAGRTMVVRRAEVIPMECVVRGYLYGSSWNEYAAGGGPTTEHLSPGLQQASRLPEPIFTPATKAQSGHDENLTEPDARALVGDVVYEELRRRSIDLYLRGAEHAAERGIILADTKFEFGTVAGELILIDEILTPDSSRYWPADAWATGTTMPSFDKQPVRDWLEGQDWDKRPPAPPLPEDIVADTRSRYIEAFERLTGRSFGGYVAAAGGLE
ncbi:MAG: phosphoribosylaminoimidazolesuccinocarboxamide synthase [Acidobacteria bacterium]|nr:phosphoribosylaminoimidazolesuccinocarboxamide synthase [Acidobacteriota bacterium]